jgi:excisionase family DNA binding protein
MSPTGKRPKVTVRSSLSAEDSKNSAGPTPALKDFIDRVIVPILVKNYRELSSGGSVVAPDPDKGVQKDKPKFADQQSPINGISRHPEPLMTGEEVAERLKIKTSTVYELTRRRTRQPLPFLKIGKYLRFRWSEIEKWLESCRGVAAR